MGDPKFPIMGADVPPMLGRAKIMSRLWSNLTKPTPSNLSLIGPRFVGKTVIMNALAQHAAREESPYAFVLHWPLGRVAPVSDAEFVAQLCDLLRGSLPTSDGKYTEHREYLGDHSFDLLREVTDSLDSDGKAILMLWDGFDKPLGQGKLSGHLWDQMRTIFYGKKHKIVTATRRPLSELIRSQEAITSPFWNIFEMPPVRVDPFDEEDRDAIIRSLSSHTFQAGAKTELVSWSAGFPPFFLAILNQVDIHTPSGQIDNQVVNEAVPKAMEMLSGVISAVWEDCPAAAKDRYLHLVEHGDLLFADVPKEERICLIEKGFARQSGNKLTASCRMLQKHLQGTGLDTGSMARVFGTWSDYKSNIRSLLERRLVQISRLDDRLKRLVARAIEDIPDYPDDCMNNLTSIEEQALDLIWQREFGETKVIPQEIIDYWKRVGATDKFVQRLSELNGNAVPPDRWFQCGLLQLLTGSRFGFESKARYATKDTYVLINAIHSFRNRTQHSDGQQMHVGVAVAAIMCCLELLSCLERGVETIPVGGSTGG